MVYFTENPPIKMDDLHDLGVPLFETSIYGHGISNMNINRIRNINGELGSLMLRSCNQAWRALVIKHGVLENAPSSLMIFPFK